jgi:hypothetical protein
MDMNYTIYPSHQHRCGFTPKPHIISCGLISWNYCRMEEGKILGYHQQLSLLPLALGTSSLMNQAVHYSKLVGHNPFQFSYQIIQIRNCNYCSIVRSKCRQSNGRNLKFTDLSFSSDNDQFQRSLHNR